MCLVKKGKQKKKRKLWFFSETTYRAFFKSVVFCILHAVFEKTSGY